MSASSCEAVAPNSSLRQMARLSASARCSAPAAYMLLGTEKP
jgi:hypothetical protein